MASMVGALPITAVFYQLSHPFTQIAIRRHFKQRIGLATGLLLSGGGLGVIYAAQLITVFNHRYVLWSYSTIL